MTSGPAVDRRAAERRCRRADGRPRRQRVSSLRRWRAEGARARDSEWLPETASWPGPPSIVGAQEGARSSIGSYGRTPPASAWRASAPPSPARSPGTSPGWPHFPPRDERPPWRLRRGGSRVGLVGDPRPWPAPQQSGPAAAAGQRPGAGVAVRGGAAGPSPTPGDQPAARGQGCGGPRRPPRARPEQSPLPRARWRRRRRAPPGRRSTSRPGPTGVGSGPAGGRSTTPGPHTTRSGGVGRGRARRSRPAARQAFGLSGRGRATGSAAERPARPSPGGSEPRSARRAAARSGVTHERGADRNLGVPTGPRSPCAGTSTRNSVAKVQGPVGARCRPPIGRPDLPPFM